tara:strand:- start:1456 stop:2331 length:876 start_codon:yes stop_codon:yes gene_type:complete
MKDNTNIGISLMILTTFLFSCMDGVSKFLAENNNVISLVALRYWFIIIFIFSYWVFTKKKILDIVGTTQPFLQFSRGLILSLNNCLVVYTFTLIGLIETHAIIACYPLIVAGLSVPFLGEKFGWRRWTAIAFGFIGVIIILRPGFGIFSLGSVFAFSGAAMFAIYLILTRYASRKDNAVTSFFWTGIGGSVTMVFMVYFFGENLSNEFAFWILMMCILSAGSHFLMVKILELVEASLIQPYSYLQLVFSSIIGIFIFFESLDLFILLGVIIVVSSGLYTFWREKVVKNLNC